MPIPLGPQTEGNDGGADHGGVKGDEGAKKTDPHEGESKPVASGHRVIQRQ